MPLLLGERQTNPLSNLKEETRQHWEQYLPRYTAHLKAQGKFDLMLKEAVQSTLDAYSRMVEKGATPQNAWEALREEWCLLPPEPKEKKVRARSLPNSPEPRKTAA
jgi:hypothetical protein